MCTITYLPFKNGYIVTQNRDESPLRADAVFPVEDEVNGQKIIYPKDPEGSGSWFVSTQYGQTLCMMNGVYHANVKPNQFRHSRGLIPLHYLQFATADDFKENYNFSGLQGFTLVICSAQGATVFDWDEHELTQTNHPAEALIFQSKPLYDATQSALRQQLFRDFLAKHNPEAILDFHTKPQTADPALNILMDRGQVKSVSTIQRNFFAENNEVSYLKLGVKQAVKANF